MGQVKSGTAAVASWGKRYGEVYAELAEADRHARLRGPDLVRLGMAAHLTGRDAESSEVLARAHRAFLAEGDASGAVRSAFWIAFMLIHKGDRAQAAGWLARARRLLDDCGEDCVERGYLLLPAALELVRVGDLQAAEEAFASAARIGDRFGDPDLANLARSGHGRALINQGRTALGAGLLDEVMVAVTAGELSPPVAGTIYCSVIEGCFEMLDMRRAQEWTDALTRWCAADPDLVPYRGLCLVRRSELMLLHGEWPEALEQAREACARLSGLPGESPGAAFYQLAELQRLRGDLAGAEEAYRRAAETGRSPQPGLALLRLAQGRPDAARAAIERAIDEAKDRRARAGLVAASVDILLAASDLEAARAAADRLTRLSAEIATPYPCAVAGQARGAVLLAAGDAKGALAVLRDAWACWRELGAPYEAARTSLLMGRACLAVGDRDGAEIELEAAAKVFREVGAGPDLDLVEELLRPPSGEQAGGLTAREVQVLRLVAGGKTNRAIAAALGISEKTVARHLSNIFTKLDLSSRSAATAYAFQHGLM